MNFGEGRGVLCLGSCVLGSFQRRTVLLGAHSKAPKPFAQFFILRAWESGTLGRNTPAATRRHHCSQQSGPLPQATKEPGKDVGSRSRTPGAVASLPARPSRPGAAAASPPSPPASLREHAQCLARFANCRGPRRAPRPARRARPRRSPHPPVVRLRRPGDRDFRAGGGP